MASTRAVDGTSIHYHDSADDAADDAGIVGTGPAVVLVHGITENAATWNPVRERLIADHRVITLDLRGHGASDPAERYDLEAMAGDVIAVVSATGVDRPHLVGHSLGGAVVSAVGAAHPVASIVNVDQSLRLDGFKEQLMPFVDQLRDPESFPFVIDAVFAMMIGDRIDPDEAARVGALRRADQDVVLGVWQLILESSVDEIAAVVDGALAGYADLDVAYLALFGLDPGDGYAAWLDERIAGATTEVWTDHGHYPHLVDPDRFVARLNDFWSR